MNYICPHHTLSAGPVCFEQENHMFRDGGFALSSDPKFSFGLLLSVKTMAAPSAMSA
jgi:hypothetical protein